MPGEVRGLEYVHRKYGSLPWPTVMMPAIKLAREGFPVSKDLARYIDYALEESGEDFLSKNPSWAADFAPNGTKLVTGDMMTRKRYADTLEVIATRGPESFYSGQLGEDFVRTVQNANGVMTREDLANYTVVIRNCSEISYRAYRIVSTTAPSSGIVVLNILKVLDTYDRLFTRDNVNVSTHRLDEAIRFAYGLVSKEEPCTALK